MKQGLSDLALETKICVIGVGGGGGNTVNNIISSDRLKGVNFIVANTDAQALQLSKAQTIIQLGSKATRGLGAGANPEVGEMAAEESAREIKEALAGADMVFVTLGLGGGTGTGGGPVIARLAKEMGILTIAVVTKPFNFEGPRRMRAARDGLAKLKQHVDTFIVIENQNLFCVAGAETTFTDAFKIADNVLRDGVCGIAELIIVPGLINLDLADITTIMRGGGHAVMGTGRAFNEQGRASLAAQRAVTNDLLDLQSVRGARRVLVNITGGLDITLTEVNEAMTSIQRALTGEDDIIGINRDKRKIEDIDIIFGSTFKPELEGGIEVSVFATAIDQDSDLGNEIKKTGFSAQSAITNNAEPTTQANVLKPIQHAEYPVDAVDYELPAFLRKTRQ